ncbi:MAG: methylenetetrahydrofolate reductase [Vicinamibacterales bacterium]
MDVVTIPDGPRGGARLSAMSAAVLMAQQGGIETLLQYSCRDRNLLGIQSDLLGAHALGLRNLLGITGDVRSLGEIPDATAVFDVDSVRLTNVINRLNHGLDIGGQPIGAPTRFLAGVMANPARDIEAEVKRLGYKVEAGAEFVVTRHLRRGRLRALPGPDRELPRAGDCRNLALRQRVARRVHGQRGAGRHRAGCAGGAHAASTERPRQRLKAWRSRGNWSRACGRWSRVCTS